MLRQCQITEAEAVFIAKYRGYIGHQLFLDLVYRIRSINIKQYMY